MDAERKGTIKSLTDGKFTTQRVIVCINHDQPLEFRRQLVCRPYLIFQRLNLI